MKKIITIGAAFAGCLLAAYYLTSTNTIDKVEEEEHHNDDFLPFSKELADANEIGIEKASPGKLKQIVRAPAQISIISDQKAHVLPKVSGIAIAAYKNLGQDVAAGEVVAVLESKEMAEAKANYLTHLKKMELAFSEYQREKTLLEKNITSVQDFNHFQNLQDEAFINLELSRQKLLTLGLTPSSIEQLPFQKSETLRLYELRSPIAGKVIDRHITPGELVTSDHEVYVIADLSTVWAEIYVFSQDRPYVQKGQSVTITNNEGQSTHATVAYLSPVIDQETRTSKAIAKIDNQSEIWFPGAYVQAQFITNEDHVPLMVKKDAIQNIDGVDVLFVSSAEGFAVRPITKGRTDEENCEVISGLDTGEDYACKNTFLLKADLKKDEAEHMD